MLFLNIVFLGFVAGAVAKFNLNQKDRFNAVAESQAIVLHNQSLILDRNRVILCSQLNALSHIALRLGIPVDFTVPGSCGETAVAMSVTPPCTITGTTDGDVVFGTEGNEVICTGDGADYVEGGEGRDRLLLGDSVDFGDGGGGPDALYGGPGDDLLIGGSDHDVLDGGPGADTLDALDGKQNDRLDGGPGNDVCVGDVGDHFTDCETVLKSGSVVMVAAFRGHPCTVTGDENNNVLVGTSASDTICAKAGNDQLQGEASADVLRGGRDNDYESGDAGADRILGHRGNDTLVGAGDHDILRGRQNNDRLFGIDQAGGDLIDGGNGEDFCFGDVGDTFLNCEHITKPKE